MTIHFGADSTSLASGDIGGGGKFVRIVEGTYSTQYSIPGSWGATGYSLSIAPAAAANKILVVFSPPIYSYRNGGTGINLRIMRGSTQIWTAAGSTTHGYYNDASGSSNAFYKRPVIFTMDHPNTTSSTTYSLEGQNYGGSTARTSKNGYIGEMYLIELDYT